MPKSAPILLTGFEPFDGQTLNPSWEVARALDGRFIDAGAGVAPARVVAVQMPCVFGAARATLDAALAAHRPRLVLALGQAGGRGALSLERIAINVDDASIPDNAGAQPIDEPIARRGPAAYFSTLPIKAIVAALNAEGIAAEVSQTAGTFVCNHLFYGLMRRLARRDQTGVRGGFLHVPWLPEQGAPAMELATMVRGVELALRTALAHAHDRRLAGGAIA